MWQPTLCYWLLFETHKNLNIDTLLLWMYLWCIESCKKYLEPTLLGFFFRKKLLVCIRWYSWDWCNCGINDIVHYIMGTWSHSTVKLHQYILTTNTWTAYKDINISRTAQTKRPWICVRKIKNKREMLKKKTHQNLI